MWKYNKEKHSVDEQPTMTKPVLNRHAFKYAHIDSSKLDEYDKHIESLRLIPVQGKVDWKDGQEIPEDWFSLDNCDCKIGIDCPYKKGKWLTPCKLAYARKDKAIGIQEQPHPKDWLIFTGEIDNIPEPQSQERQQADKWGKYPHLSKWKSDYNEAIQKDITLPQYQKKFGEWLDNWIKENQSQEQQPVSDKEQPQQEANTYAILEAKYKKLLLEQNEMLRQQLNQPVLDKDIELPENILQELGEKEVMMQAFDKVRDLFERRTWIMEGRGSYPYNDDRYKEEVRYLYDEFVEVKKTTWANIKTKTFEYREKIIADFKAALNKQGSDGWISVEDRLPEIYQTVAFVVKSRDVIYNNKVMGGMYQGNDLGYFQFSTPGMGWEGIFWQPLPAPPNKTVQSQQEIIKTKKTKIMDAEEIKYMEWMHDLTTLGYTQEVVFLVHDSDLVQKYYDDGKTPAEALGHYMKVKGIEKINQ